MNATTCPVCGFTRYIKPTSNRICSGCRRYESVTVDPRDGLTGGRWVTKPGGIQVWEEV